MESKRWALGPVGGATIARAPRLASLTAAIALVLGYLCAFAGHWWVERNRPLTFEHPLRAGLCNWRLFGVECAAMLGLGGGFEAALDEAVGRHPEVLGWMCDAGGQ